MSDTPMRGLVPAPRLIVDAPGRLALGGGFRVAAGAGLEDKAELLVAWLSGLPGVGVAHRAGGACPAGLPEIRLEVDGALPGREEYRLLLGGAGARVSGGSAEGVVRGMATLRELALSEGAAIAGLRIEDGPRFPWRGFMLDCARNFFSVEFIERLIDLAALHRLNVFHWHLTDDQAWRLDLPGLPELAREGSRRLDHRFNPPARKSGAYGPDDVRRVVRYAQQRCITVVPEIEMPGHAVALLASHPELSCAAAISARGSAAPSFMPEDRYGIFEDILCAGNEAVFDLIGRVFDGLVELFPGPYVHVGGDEAPKARWKACPSCASRMRELGLRSAESGEASAEDLERLQAWFMGRAGAMLAARGRRMVGWDEILDAEGAGDAAIPADAIVMSWRGYSGGLAGARRGHDVVMCPQTKACYLDHKHLDRVEEPGQLGVCSVRDSYLFEAMPGGLDEAEAVRILGGQGNLWSELVYFGKQAEYMMYPRLCALSEALWCRGEDRDFEEFSARLPIHLRRLDALGVNYYRGPLCDAESAG